MVEELLQKLLTPGGFTLILGGIILLAVASITFQVLLSLRLYTRANGPWGRFASRYGLQLVPGRLLLPQRIPAVQGHYRGREILLAWWRRRSHNSTSWITETFLRASLRNPENWELRLAPENLLDKLVNTLGGEDVRIGDSTFDDRISIRNRPEEAAALLVADAGLRERILGLRKWDALTLKDEELQLVLRGMELKEDRLSDCLTLLLEVAQRIEDLHR